MSPHTLCRSEAFAEDLPGFGSQPMAIPRAAAAASLLTLLAPLS